MSSRHPSGPAPTRLYRVAAAVVRPVVLGLFRPRVDGAEHLPPAGGFVLAPVQLSNLDGVAFAHALHPRQVRWMGKAELFRPPLAPILRQLGVFPVRRGTGDLAAVRTAVALAAGGHPVGIFPEGTRRRKGLRKRRQPRPFTGAARVALAAGVPLVPAALAGTERLLGLRRWRVAIGAAVSLDDLAGSGSGAAGEATRRLMVAIGALEDDLHAQASPGARRLHPRLRLDVGFGDLLAGAAGCVVARRGRSQARLLDACGDAEALPCLSVRSGFELLLDALALAPGDEVAFSAVTHPDMPWIAAVRGLVVAPVDVDPATFAPRPGALEQTITARTRVLVVAHLFGARVDLTPVAAAVRRHGVLLVEDCAQALTGPPLAVDPHADVALYSFGPIKTATALGGGLALVRDPDLRAHMRHVQGQWPGQTRREYALRLVRFAGLRALCHPRAYWLFARVLQAGDRDLDVVVQGAVRGFPGPELTRRLRRRPSAPLLALMARRLRRFDHAHLAARTAAGDGVVAALAAGLAHVGHAARDPTHWVVPVAAPDRDGLVTALRRVGFDAAGATSGIAVVAAPADRLDLRAAAAEELMAGVVFVPAYPQLGGPELRRLTATLAQFGAATT